MKKILTLLLTIIISADLRAQSNTLQLLPGQWSLEECIAYAKTHNIQLNTLRLSTASAEQDLIQSKANKLPNLSGSITQSIVNSNNTDPVVGGFTTQASFTSGYGLNSSFTLYNGGYLKNDIKAKELSIQSANLAVAETANDITLNITQAFLNILLAKENITALKDVLATSEAQLKQGQQRYNAGSISKKDLLQFESQLATDNYNLVSAENTYRLNLITLKQLLQLPEDVNFAIAAPEDIQPHQAVINLESAQAAAQENRPEVKNKEVAIQLSETELAKIKAGYLPTISLGAGLSSGYSDNQASKYLTQLTSNFYQSLGLTVNIPIFSRKQNKTNVAKANIGIQQSKLDLLNTKTVLNQQVEQAYINLQNAQAQYAAAETQKNAAEESYQITNEQLRLGAVNALEALQQKNTYVQSLQAAVQAKYSAVLYNKIYDFYTGVPVSF